MSKFRAATIGFGLVLGLFGALMGLSAGDSAASLVYVTSVGGLGAVFVLLGALLPTR